MPVTISALFYRTEYGRRVTDVALTSKTPKSYNTLIFILAKAEKHKN
ncbi:hypothetical protein LV83_02417 [Algoriphagus yeomjeoni]|uniref:Uncharacterized protein n=1 Tax=Algoriphagus yeomjeoni TaxID=291403 RepID=A0A327PI31_9BACT|nr:hypothetical protein LV83_02417 [Algoriphagus yeomjeoni]